MSMGTNDYAVPFWQVLLEPWLIFLLELVLVELCLSLFRRILYSALHLAFIQLPQEVESLRHNAALNQLLFLLMWFYRPRTFFNI